LIEIPAVTVAFNVIHPTRNVTIEGAIMVGLPSEMLNMTKVSMNGAYAGYAQWARGREGKMALRDRAALIHDGDPFVPCPSATNGVALLRPKLLQ
jgi:hypothetical protein